MLAQWIAMKMLAQWIAIASVLLGAALVHWADRRARERRHWSRPSHHRDSCSRTERQTAQKELA
jgi:hypothetical protein